MWCQEEANRRMHALYLHQLQVQQQQYLMATRQFPSTSSAGFVPQSQVSTSMAENGFSSLPSFYPTHLSQFPINPSSIHPTTTNNNYPIYPSSTFTPHLQHASYTLSSLNNTLPQENHVTNPTSDNKNPILNQKPENPMVDPSHTNIQYALLSNTLTTVSPCQTLKPQQTTLENPNSYLTSLAYLTLKLGDWNALLGVQEMFDESMYPIIRTKYKLITEPYLPSDFIPIFGQMQEQEEEDKKIIFFGSLEHGSSRSISLLPSQPEESTKESIFVPSLSNVLLDGNAKFGGLNSLLVVEQPKPIHQNSITDSHNFARIRLVFSADMVVSVLPPLLQRETYLEFGDACVAKDKDANFVDMLKQGEYNDPVITATDELLRAKSMLLLQKRLLQGMAASSAFSYGFLITLLKESSYKGKCRCRVYCVATSWDPGGSYCAMKSGIMLLHIQILRAKFFKVGENDVTSDITITSLLPPSCCRL